MARAAHRRGASRPARGAGPAGSQQARQPRLPFGSLVEAGLLQPGQQLFFDRDLQRAATILANGHLGLNGFTGSIHQVAALYWAASPPTAGSAGISRTTRAAVRA